MGSRTTIVADRRTEKGVIDPVGEAGGMGSKKSNKKAGSRPTGVRSGFLITTPIN